MSSRRYIQIPKGPILVNYGTLIKTISTEQRPIVCRACLSDANLRPLSNTVAEIFSDLLKTKYVFEDTSPQFLCTICLGLLKKFHLFKNQCDRSQRVMEKLHRSRKLSKETLKAEKEPPRFALNLSAIENTDFRQSVKLVYTKTLCIDVARRHKRNPNCDPVPRGRKKNVKVKKKAIQICPPKIYNIVNESSGRASQSLELIGAEDSSDEMPPTYNGIPLFTDGEIERMEQQTRGKQMKVKERNQMSRKRQNVERDDSDTLTASSCEEHRQAHTKADMNQQIDTVRHVESDHLYAKPPAFKSERLNQRMKLNKVNRSDQYIYSDIKRQLTKTKLTLGYKKKHHLPSKKCKKECDIIVKIPDEKIESNTDSEEDTKPDIDSILLSYLKDRENVNNSCEDIKPDISYEDIKPDVEELFVK